ncbi:hypothetical protein CAMRE0001_0677 [Campylobacter rectus RM3267]|uniref:Uncharacterized protein n=1 Tax=Campylobacter rectus RM3267 TaxID=553218 RepID=B9D1L3_CAMRE|nr:hypothetical protein CAMRE0001_0677 [Campylobacter rectus RM3267]
MHKPGFIDVKSKGLAKIAGSKYKLHALERISYYVVAID